MDVNKTLLQKYYDGTCNEEEGRVVEKWLHNADAFSDNLATGKHHAAKARMWNVIRNSTIGNAAEKSTSRGFSRRFFALAACFLLFVTTCLVLWERHHALPVESAYVIIDNTRSSLSTPQKVGEIILSESANSALNNVSVADSKESLMFTNYLVINNQKGEDIWVYLKTSSEKGSGMMKFLCKEKSTYVAGYVTEHTQTGRRKFLYSKQSGPSSLLPEEIVASINN